MITASTDALEVRNEAMGRHALRVHRYAVELTDGLAPSLLTIRAEYGFLLHDIGKTGAGFD
jgi:HD-GYP domain-containing protein (c-di-GMP phosphodiesterase class II)